MTILKLGHAYYESVMWSPMLSHLDLLEATPTRHPLSLGRDGMCWHSTEPLIKLSSLFLREIALHLIRTRQVTLWVTSTHTYIPILSTVFPQKISARLVYIIIALTFSVRLVVRWLYKSFRLGTLAKLLNKTMATGPWICNPFCPYWFGNNYCQS